MRLTLFKKTIMISLAALFILGGCATTEPQKNKRYVWPRPPDQPRIEWLKSYYGQNDFPKSGFTVFKEILFGGELYRLFQKPIDIKSNGKGVVYITDIFQAGIFVFDLQAQTIAFWEQGTDPDSSLTITPFYLSLDADGNIYVVGTGRKDIFVLNPKGVPVKRISFSGKVDSPGGIAVSSKANRIYLVDGGGHKVAVFDLAGNHLFSFGKVGEGDGEFNRPSPISVNNKGEVIVGDTMNARVQVFDKDGKFLHKFGRRGDGPGDFQLIKGVAVDSDDNIYVTDGKANQLKIFNRRGEFLLKIGVAYSITQTMKEAPGGFLLPQGIHIDDTDTIYIADQANMRFQVFRYLKDGAAGQAKPATTEPAK